jgi:hypothetical protein
MQFTTKVSIQKSQNPIIYESKIMAFGSCFAENIGTKFDYYKFQNNTNPFGIIFNPVSIKKLVHRIVNQIKFTQEDIFYHNDLWHCYEVHSQLSNLNKEEFLETLNQIIEQSYNQIIHTSHFIITYGTSWVYRLRQAQSDKCTLVANCHKVPQKEFAKELLSTEIIEKSIQNTVDLIQKVNPKCQFIFTISPVRHIKDGFIENTLSKSHLISALHKALDFQLPTFDYFPSYEIMMDELRDYRFYADDMLHPNQTAIDYIWYQFLENYIHNHAYQTLQEVEAIQKALNHKPFNPTSESHIKFLETLELKIHKLKNQFPFIQF